MASNIDATFPPDGVNVFKAEFRNQLAAIKAEMNHGGFAEGLTPTHYGPAADSRVKSHLAAIDAKLGGFGGGATFLERGLVTPEQHGAVGDGSIDDRNALDSAIADAKSNGKSIWFRRGAVYRIGSPLSPITDWSAFTWFGNDATIILDEGYGSQTGVAFDLRRCSHFKMFDLTFDGNAHNRSGVSLTEAYTNYELVLRGCTDFWFVRCRAINNAVDGWYVRADVSSDPDTVCRRGFFIDCVADRPIRNGISFIAAHDMVIRGGVFSRAWGRSPAAGIDLEPSSGVAEPGCKGFVIEGNLFWGNAGFGLMLSSKADTQKIVVANNIFRDTTGRMPAAGIMPDVGSALRINARDVIVTGNLFFDHHTAIEETCALIHIPGSTGTTGGHVLITNNHIRDCPMVGAHNFYGLIHARGTGANRRITIANNYLDITGSAKRGIFMECDDVLITGNRIIGDANANTAILAPGADNLITSNIVRSGNNNQISAAGSRSQVANNITANGA